MELYETYLNILNNLPPQNEKEYLETQLNNLKNTLSHEHLALFAKQLLKATNDYITCGGQEPIMQLDFQNTALSMA